MRVDAHHHFWRYDARQFDWIDDSMAALKRDFLPADFELLTQDAGIDASVAVQARQTVDETRWLLELAAKSPLIRGVVGWLPLAAADFTEQLQEFAADPLLKGLRHVVQGEADGFMDASAFNRGIAALEGTGLVYDLLIVERQLPEAIRLVDRHPEQSFVVDHFAKPDLRSGTFNAWSSAIRALAERPHVTLKLSGLVAEADWRSWTPQQLQPYFDTVLDAFTPSRLMFASDWPVLTVASTYERWLEVVRGSLEQISPAERALIEGGTAARVYHLGDEQVKAGKERRATS